MMVSSILVGSVMMLCVVCDTVRCMFLMNPHFLLLFLLLVKYSDHCRNQTECDRQIRQDVKALLRYGFSSLKVDGCGNEIDLHVWNKYIEQYTTSNFTTNTTRRKILVENCHGPDPKFKPNRTLPPSEGCPYHFYRTSTDIRNNYPSIMHNLGTIESYRKSNSSYPGCWAYADMLQVGVRDGLSLAETRSHFGGWSIVSSPLILSHDVNDDSIMDKIWDIISNREVLEINQAYFGDSGGTYNVANETIVLQHDKYKSEVPVYQYLSKPIRVNMVAVLLMNSDDTERMLRTSFDDIPGLADGTSSVHDNGNDNNNDNNDDEYYLVRDMWNHRDMGAFQSSVTMSVGSHDAAFLLIEKRKGTVSAIAKDAVSNSLMVLMN